MRASLLAAVLVIGCQSEPKREPPPRPDATERPAAATASAATAASAAPSGSSVRPAAGAEAFVGTWEGRYDAKKGSAFVPKDVKDKSPSDDGKRVVGAGTVTLKVAPDGRVTGTSKGALGELDVSGKTDGEWLRATLTPLDPSAPEAMTGILVGPLRDGVVKAEIRVAGPRADLVRESAIVLEKK